MTLYLAVVAVLLVNDCHSEHVPLIVKTSTGTVEGFYHENSRAFLGIPYAQPPTGNLRFSLPVPVTPWDGIRKATTWGHACPQFPPNVPLLSSQSEDCLQLNIFTPTTQKKPGELWPVLFWIHGGCYNEGGSHLMEGFNLASYVDAVVVSIDYRLNVLGFTVLPELLSNGQVNFGFHDQNLAMGWFHANAKAFGADPDRVMIFGQSAGGGSVGSHMVWEKSWPYFSRAILESPDTMDQSGSCHYYDKNEALAASHRLAARVGCGNATNVLSCLREKPWQEMRDKAMPTVDGKMFTNYPRYLMEAGHVHKIPVITGNVACELCGGTNKSFGPPPPYGKGISNQTYEHEIHRQWPKYADQILTLYKEERAEKGNWGAYAHLTSDFDYTCGAHRTTVTLSKQVPAIWRYWFDEHTVDWPYHFLNSTHEGEVPYIFRNASAVCPYYIGYKGFNAKEMHLANLMAQLWETFAAYGDPTHHKGAAFWPQYNEKNQTVLLLNNDVHPVEFPDRRYCAFWDKTVRHQQPHS